MKDILMAQVIDGNTYNVWWNGSATFRVYIDDREVFVFTRYGKDTPGGPCTPEEATDAMRWYLEGQE